MTPARNDFCPCGSGKKYKHCCGSATAARPADPRFMVRYREVVLVGGTPTEPLQWRDDETGISLRYHAG